jgi:hypothetical protein
VRITFEMLQRIEERLRQLVSGQPQSRQRWMDNIAHLDVIEPYNRHIVRGIENPILIAARMPPIAVRSFAAKIAVGLS